MRQRIQDKTLHGPHCNYLTIQHKSHRGRFSPARTVPGGVTAASTQGEEASETSGSTYSDNENTETYDYEETYTDTYSEGENAETSDYEDTHADTYPGSEAADASDSEDINTGIGPERPDETEWSAYEVGNPQR